MSLPGALPADRQGSPSATWRASDVAIYAVEQCSEDHRPFFANLNNGETEDVAKSA